MNLNNKRILVTGAGGFIGSHLAERLTKSNAVVRAFVHYNAIGSWGWLDESPQKNDMEIVAGDIRDRDSVQEAMKDIEIVFHLAALIAIPYSYNAPESYVKTNIEGTLNVLQAARSQNIEKFIHTSTSEVYGTARFVPITEDHPLQGQSPYSATKIAADKLIEAFYLSYGLPVTTVRPFNTYGPRQSARAVIPTIITQCLTKKILYLGNLSPTRDLNFVENIVDGFILAALKTEAVGETINLGSGLEISIGQLAREISDMIGRPLKIETEIPRVRPAGSEVERLCANNSKAKFILGWEPTINLKAGLWETIQWIEKHVERYRPDVYTI